MPEETPSPIKVTIPLVNPNEPEALLATLFVSEGQLVQRGDLLCTLETTKSTLELYAEASGYLSALSHQQAEYVRAGEILCYISNKPGLKPPAQESLEPKPGEITSKLRITKPALALAQANQLNLDQFPVGELITEKRVRERLASQSQPFQLQLDEEYDANTILVYGGGGHGKSLIELIRALERYHVEAVVDDGKNPGDNILGVTVIGGNRVLPELHRLGLRLAANAVGGIGDIRARLVVFNRLQEAGFDCPTLVHPSAVVEASALLAEGVHVFPQAYVGSQTRLGFGVIINTSAIISHDCNLGDYANISPGAILAGEVQVGERVLVGMGATINLQVRIGAGARIGNGATVKADVPENGIVRAGTIWPV